MGTTNIVKADEETMVPVLGANLRTATDEEKSTLGIDNGVKVAELKDGKLRQQGIKKGFIITKIDKKRVHSPSDVVALLDNAQGGVLIEGIYPNGNRGYYAIGW